MNKLLLMSAAAAFSAAGASFAAAQHPPSKTGHTSFYMTTGSGGSFCNEWSVYWFNTHDYANTDNLKTYCGLDYSSWGLGQSGQTTRKKSSGFIDLPSSVSMAEGYPSYASDFVVGGKTLKTGEAIVGLGTHSGTSIFEFSAGKIVLGQFDKRSLKALKGADGKFLPIQALLTKYAFQHGRK